MSQRTGCPIVASRATRWAEWGGPLLTTTCGWKRRTSARARRAARKVQPLLSSGNARNAASSVRSAPRRPPGLAERANRVPLGDDPSDRSSGRRTRR